MKISTKHQRRLYVHKKYERRVCEKMVYNFLTHASFVIFPYIYIVLYICTQIYIHIFKYVCVCGYTSDI